MNAIEITGLVKTFGVDALRISLTNVSQFGFVFDIGVMSLLTAVILIFGNRAFEKMQV